MMMMLMMMMMMVMMMMIFFPCLKIHGSKVPLPKRARRKEQTATCYSHRRKRERESIGRPSSVSGKFGSVNSAIVFGDLIIA